MKKYSYITLLKNVYILFLLLLLLLPCLCTSSKYNSKYVSLNHSGASNVEFKLYQRYFE